MSVPSSTAFVGAPWPAASCPKDRVTTTTQYEETRVSHIDGYYFMRTKSEERKIGPGEDIIGVSCNLTKTSSREHWLDKQLQRVVRVESSPSEVICGMLHCGS